MGVYVLFYGFIGKVVEFIIMNELRVFLERVCNIGDNSNISDRIILK